MTPQGSPYTIFRRALDRGDLAAVRAAAAELPGPAPLDDALVICLLLADHEPARFQSAAVRWLGRMLLERPGLTLGNAELAARQLTALANRSRRPEALSGLAQLGRTAGLPRLEQRLSKSR